MWLHALYLACLLTSIIVGFVYHNSLGSRGLFLFPFYLSLVLIQELSLFILLRYDSTYSTGIVYNIYNPVNAVFYSAFYYRVPFLRDARRLIGLLIVAFVLVNIFTFLFIQPIAVYNSYLSLASGFLITLCGIIFLFNYFRLDSHAEEKKWLPVIWITIGLVSFYPVVNISFALYKYLLAYQATLFGIKLYRLIPQLMSIIMYVCFTRAFYLCSKKE